MVQIARSSSSSASTKSTIVRSRNAVRLTKAALQTAFVVSEDLGASFAERLFTTPRRHARPKREREALATARESIIEITLRSPRSHNARIPITTWRWTPANPSGATVLLVHGWEGRGSQLGAFVAPLLAAGLSVVAFDAPAHGDSAGSRLYLTDFADCVADIAAAIAPTDGSPLHGIVAHSFGAAAVLLAHERHGLSAARNVLVSPNVIIDDAVRRFARLVGLDDADRILLEQRIAAHSGIAPESLKLERLIGTRDEALLVIHDKDDREVSFEHGDRLAALWPNAKLLPTTGLGHRRILRDPAVLDAAVDLLREGTASSREPVSDLVREVDRQLATLETTTKETDS